MSETTPAIFCWSMLLDSPGISALCQAQILNLNRIISVSCLFPLLCMSKYGFCLVNAGSATDAMITHSYILTLPAEWRLYRSQSSITRLRYVKNHCESQNRHHSSGLSSVACILFILIRYTSILTLFISMCSAPYRNK
jgi:hypothetical protein